jgi:hypothetical protein
MVIRSVPSRVLATMRGTVAVFEAFGKQSETIGDRRTAGADTPQEAGPVKHLLT